MIKISRRRWLLYVSPLVGAALLLVELDGLGNVLMSPSSRYSDLLLSHWPNAHFFRESIRQFHTWPLWNPNQFLGVPFSANPLSGVWYPPNWILAFVPLTPGFNLLLGLHLWWGGIGAIQLYWRVDQTERVSDMGAVVAGLAWTLAPRIWGHLGAGHVGLVYAAGWLPWVLAHAIDLDRRLDRTQDRICFSWLPASWAMMFLADVRLAAYSAMAIGVVLLTGRPGTDPQPQRQLTLGRRGRMKWLILSWIAAGSLALAISSILWIPLIEYLPWTSRVGLSTSESAAFSLPAEQLLTVLWPDRGGFHEWMIYAGASILVLGVLGWLDLSRKQRLATVAAVVVMVLYALGENGPLFSLVARLPGVSLLRVPPRVWFLLSLMSAILAGLGVRSLLSAHSGKADLYTRRLGRRALSGMGFFALALTGLMAVAMWMRDRVHAEPFLAAFCWMTLSILIIWLLGRKSRTSEPWLLLVPALVVAELIWMDTSLVTGRLGDELFADGLQTAEFLSEQNGRVYLPDFRPAPQVTTITGLRVVSGVDPLQPSAFAQLLLHATEGRATGDYHITLPPLPDASMQDSRKENLEPLAAPAMELLSLFDVRFIATERAADVISPERVFESPEDGLTVYRNPTDLALPAVYRSVEMVPDMESAIRWVQAKSPSELGRTAVVVGEGEGMDLSLPRAQASLETLSPNRLELSAEGPGLLVVSEMYYTGWRASVDGEPADVVPVDGVLRGVFIDAGHHRIDMQYCPWTAWAGVLVSVLAIGILLVWRASLGGKGRRHA